PLHEKIPELLGRRVLVRYGKVRGYIQKHQNPFNILRMTVNTLLSMNLSTPAPYLKSQRRHRNLNCRSKLRLLRKPSLEVPKNLKMKQRQVLTNQIITMAMTMHR